jgi:hypothetical protein
MLINVHDNVQVTWRGTLTSELTFTTYPKTLTRVDAGWNLDCEFTLA